MDSAGVGNFVNDSLLIGMSDLVEARTRRPLVLTGGRGVFVIDERGREYMEAVSAFSCAALGFNEPELVEAARRQMSRLPMAPTAYNRTAPVVLELAERLAEVSPIPNARIAFTTTGSEANDNLVKFTWYGNVHAGEPGRRRIISRRGSYHGHTVLTNGMGGNPDAQHAYGIPMQDHLHVSQPSGPAPGEGMGEYVARLAEELRDTIDRAAPETIAAFIAEPISFSADVAIPPDGYFRAIKAVLDDYGIRLYADEVLSGFGRTGEMWGCASFDISPDCVTSSKGLSSAYQPIGAIFMSPEFYERIEAASVANGWFSHAATYHAHPVAAAVALKVLDIWRERRLLDHVRAIVPVWREAIDGLSDHPLVASTRSQGLMSGIDLRTERGAETRLLGGQPARGIAKAVYDAAFDEGLIIRPGTDMIKMTPPIIISEEEIHELVRRLRRALDVVLHGRRHGGPQS